MRYEFLGAPVDVLTMDETLSAVVTAMRTGQRTSHVALNVAKLVAMRSDPVLQRDVSTSDIVGIDGMGIVWGARLCGIPASERVAGIDLMEAMLVACAAESFRPFFLGATPEVVERAAALAAAKHPGLVLAGVHHGYFTTEDEPSIVAAINESKADCVFLGMPTPRKERFLARHRPSIAAPVIMGVGGSFDILAGKTLRAPMWMQKKGLEWLYRLLQEPRRMLRRYVTTNTMFILLLARHKLGLDEARRPASS